MKRATHLIFPTLAVTGLFIALLNYMAMKEIVDYKEKQLDDFDQRMTNIEQSLKMEEKVKTLGETTNTSYDELLRELELDNRILKESTYKLSPDRKKAAYFQNKLTTDIKEIGDRDYTSLIIDQNGQAETVFQGDFRLSYFEWLNDKEIAVYRGCGTECMLAYIVDIDTKKYHEISLGVGYTWSPDKQYVLAYHYSYQYGISVAEKSREYGRTIFQIRRSHPRDGSGLASQTKAAWSEDSAKLALIIRKEDKEQLELLVFAVKQNFELLLQQDLAGDSLTGLGWNDQLTVFYTIGEETKKVSI